MNRVIAFGCSHTYGHGLEDCFIKETNGPGPNPSKLSWPNHLGNLTGREVINLSRPGASNLEILYNILKFDFQKDDLVVILWADFTRDLIFTDINPASNYNLEFFPVGSWMTKKNSNVDIEAWITVHTDYDLLMRSFIYIHHAEEYLKNKKIKNYSFFQNSKDTFPKIPKFLKFNNLMNIQLHDILFLLYDRALDGIHPGTLAQQKVAEEIYKIIND